MNKEELAQLLNGRQYGSEITKEEEALAKKDGLLVIYGASDDLAEVAGIFRDEVGCYNGGEIWFNRDGLLPEHDDSCDCNYCGYEEAKEFAFKVEAIWSKEGYSWIYKTDIPHATFDIMEDSDKYCRGIVIDLSNLRQ